MRIVVLGPAGRNAAIASLLRERGHSVLVTETEATLDRLKAERAEFILSSGYGPIIREPILGAFADRIVNLHNSFLPWGRGIFPVLWAVLEGAPTGVTIHRIEAGIDSGAILAQRQIPARPDETMRTFHDRLLDALTDLFREVCDDILCGRAKLIAQDQLGVRQPYRNRLDAERMADLLPMVWDTPIARVREIGMDLALSRSFWSAYERV